MGDVDELISELFPESSEKLDSLDASVSKNAALPASQTNWDAETPTSQPKAAQKRTSMPSSSDQVVPPGVRHGSIPVRRVMDFDEDSDEDMGGSGHHAHPRNSFTVPFPAHPSHSAYTCQGRCYVTNAAAPLPHPHPPLAELRLIAQGKRPCPSEMESMWRRGAFYVSEPTFGNGALDLNRTDASQTEGGCTHMLCLKCNYMVVRLQGAAWDDGDGATNLYLTTRNFYPDWSRLANSYAVGTSTNKGTTYVLVADASAAAYCCQCAWLTVRSPMVCIETRLTDVPAYRSHTAEHPFATELPLRKGETRRPPLWTCKGHAI
ncbi:hypothetical protein STCU_04448 [Strigomonas culicis]|uniref:Cilia- and flagella-associated protein 418 n=1 Tax=Strigomonas culicis TaxID=28005 RepID=S9UKY9_9TRYP|nr:hypothetical protein STCU_07888 [Strigomonas culicis]EPY29573.1 hypothetical protein STCU_04448 [Strigomonas culicis]|eukprot:EPY23070.1 hypothetical protein STCU_07888 [Strigomonas culicis]